MNNKTIHQEPALMTVVINIQAMSKKIGNEIPFKELEHKTSDELHALQKKLIPHYNKAVQS